MERLGDVLSLEAIKEAYDSLREATDDYLRASFGLALNKRAYEKRRLELIREGIEGKNAEQREAALAQMLTHENENLERAEDHLAINKARFELAQINVEYVRLVIRYAELVKGLK